MLLHNWPKWNSTISCSWRIMNVIPSIEATCSVKDREKTSHSNKSTRTLHSGYNKHINTSIFIHDHSDPILITQSQLSLVCFLLNMASKNLMKGQNSTKPCLIPTIHLHCLDRSGRRHKYKSHHIMCFSIMENMQPELQQRQIRYILFSNVFKVQTHYSSQVIRLWNCWLIVYHQSY